MLARWYELVGRRRLIIGLAAAVAVTLVAAMPGLIAGGGTSSTHLRAATAAPTAGEAAIVQPPAPGVITPTEPQPLSGGPTTSVPPTTTPPAVLGFQVTRIVGRAPAPAGAVTTTTVRRCRNSTDPACGPFSWDPSPGPNQPVTGQVTAAPSSPGAGQTVTFHITASDPDAAPVVVCGEFYGDGADVVCDPGPRVNPNTCPRRYGPWTPPARQPGTLDTTTRHTYAKPGTYTASFEVNSAQEVCNNPYASSTVVRVTVVVTPSAA